tara:strand:- start:6339 stop:6818 length:480 start_codon:yes stop_codon:yes gene_type:complete
MPDSSFLKVAAFHNAFNLPVNIKPKLPEIESDMTEAIEEEFNRTISRLVTLIDKLKRGNTTDNSRLRRIRIVVEEFTEYLEAEKKNDLIEIADALIDLEYVIHGTHLEYGLPYFALFYVVHEANMAKLEDGKPIKDLGGKIIKPLNWKKPNIKEVIDNA